MPTKEVKSFSKKAVESGDKGNAPVGVWGVLVQFPVTV